MQSLTERLDHFTIIYRLFTIHKIEQSPTCGGFVFVQQKQTLHIFLRKAFNGPPSSIGRKSLLQFALIVCQIPGGW